MGRLFSPFERIDTHLRIKAGGTGLGLYLTKKIANDLLQGEVGAESVLGEGSNFWIEIPLAKVTVQTESEKYEYCVDN
jgi:signal transduction histidine kinase